MFIWVSKDSPQELIQNILGVPHFGAIVEDMVWPHTWCVCYVCVAFWVYCRRVVESISCGHFIFVCNRCYMYVYIVPLARFFFVLSQIALPSLDNGLSNMVNMLVSQIRKCRQHFMPLLVIR